ncbi:hypothetical protein ACFQI7_10540 [Paenibacillus allorhizosphaerae]|uniref:DUF1045 domain-containing protein n=1 Tax=Paenibacillus allorhizosphaerae TaxID=2849866 RepID=A0ABM8VHZ9_9BACL|nr:hypothetical protein [Paenibacillus allorhizosphaerae]CAG7643252.1 hypothetical protein PAECIP111802_02979 [Paenibacillus allorhizosphaerae]
MITITNRKVQGFQPVWAPFYGFSLLFDHQGDSYCPITRTDGLEKLCCRTGVKELSFYQTLWEQAKETGHMERKYLFCPLPLHSYHVTVWDGLNDYNVNKLRESDRTQVAALLKGLPGTMLTDRSILFMEDARPLTIQTTPIQFKYDKLEKWNNSSIVARIKPANDESVYRLERIEDNRSKLNQLFLERYGIATSTTEYRPHVSIGYFANKELGALAEAAVDELHGRLETVMKGRTITFYGISLYGMTDMETFIRKQR